LNKLEYMRVLLRRRDPSGRLIAKELYIAEDAEFSATSGAFGILRKEQGTTMANPFTRGSGDFKRRHEKLGGRKPGTKNLFSTEHKMAILEAAYRVGYDGNGKDGVRGYLTWVGERDPGFFYAKLWVSLLLLEEAEACAPERPRPIVEDNQVLRDLIARKDQRRAADQAAQDESQAPRAWTAQPSPVGDLMQLAVENHQAFCKLIIAGLLQPPAKRRRRGDQRKIEGS
jgi:hypothetical protein